VNRILPVVAALAIGLMLAIAGCGDGDNSGGYGSGGASSSEPSESRGSGTTAAAVVSAANVPELGSVIVDSRGFTLYDFHKDKGTESACYGECAQVWPPLITSGAPVAEAGAEDPKLGTTKRKDGSVQVTYAGHPLYTYTADTKPGDAKGNDIDSFGAEWYALQPNGEEPGD
jgi:predicted lipoprotein with Yx(FWY)xxD motif